MPNSAPSAPTDHRSHAPQAVSVGSLMRSVGLATVLPLVLGVAGAPLLARAMDPSDRGRLAGILAAATIANVIALGGATQRLPKQLANVMRSEVWPVFIDTLRRLGPLAAACSVALGAASLAIWPGSMVRGVLVALLVAIWWLLGIVRGIVTGIGDHRRASGTFLTEAVVRVAAIVVLAVAWERVGATIAVALVGILPTVVALLVLGPVLIRLRREAAPAAVCDSQVAVENGGYSSTVISLSQQLMGRSILSVWAITMSAETVGYFAVAFALTELTVNFARVAQPFVIQRAESGKSDLRPWMILTSLSAVASAVGGVIVLEPFFGAEYADAAMLVVPLAVAQGLFSIVVFQTGVQFVTDPEAVIRSVRRWQGASLIVTAAAAAVLSPVAVAVIFALLAGLQAIDSIRANRSAAAMARPPAVEVAVA